VSPPALTADGNSKRYSDNKYMETKELQAPVEDWDSKDSVVGAVVTAAGPWLAAQGLVAVGFTTSGVAAGKYLICVEQPFLVCIRQSRCTLAKLHRKHRGGKPALLTSISWCRGVP